jgi:hypothetical protein
MPPPHVLRQLYRRRKAWDCLKRSRLSLPNVFIGLTADLPARAKRRRESAEQAGSPVLRCHTRMPLAGIQSLYIVLDSPPTRSFRRAGRLKHSGMTLTLFTFQSAPKASPAIKIGGQALPVCRILARSWNGP